MHYAFPYDTIEPVDILPSHPLDVYTVGAIEGIRAEPNAVVAASLAAPIGMPRISEIITGGSRILIIVDDMSRPTPVYQIVPSLLRELALGGAHDANIRFLVALGTHRRMTAEEIAAKIGADAAARFTVVNHEWNNPAALHDYGQLGDMHVVLNRAMHESDVVIGVGSIAPHPLNLHSPSGFYGVMQKFHHDLVWLGDSLAALRTYDVQSDRLVVRAPQDGIVMVRNLEVGEVVGPGATVFVLGQLDTLQLTVYLPEDSYGQVKLGQVAGVTRYFRPTRAEPSAPWREANAGQIISKLLDAAE